MALQRAYILAHKTWLVSESNRERIAFGPLLITVLFLALKKTGFSKKKNSSQKKYFFFLPCFYATFQCGHYNVFKFFFFFDHKKLKKPPSKVAHNRPKPFLRQSSPSHSPQPRFSIPFYKTPNPNVSLLVSES